MSDGFHLGTLSLADKVWNLKFEVKDQDQVFNVSSLDPEYRLAYSTDRNLEKSKIH